MKIPLIVLLQKRIMLFIKQKMEDETVSSASLDTTVGYLNKMLPNRIMLEPHAIASSKSELIPIEQYFAPFD